MNKFAAWLRLSVGLGTLFFLCLGGPSLAQDLLIPSAQLEDYGKSRHAIPETSGQWIDDGFFTADYAMAAASREYYTAVYAIPASVDHLDDEGGRVRSRPLVGGQLTLELANPGELTNDVVISVRFRDGSRNHLVRVEPNTRIRVTRALSTKEALGPMQSLQMVAFFPFEVNLDLAEAGGAKVSQILEVMAPHQPLVDEPTFEKALDYCQDLTSWIRVIDTAGASVIARSVRRNGYYYPTIYNHDIEYPAGTIFHRAAGAQNPIPDVPCARTTQKTRRNPPSDFTHTWTGLDELVFACSGPATAVCTYGCSASFTVTLAGISIARCF